MLILVNGRRGYDELAELGQMLGDPERLLEQLEQFGYIEPGDARPGPESAPAALLPVWGNSGWGPVSAPAPLMPELPARTSAIELTVPKDVAQRFAIECLKDLLGPAADDLCGRLESASNDQEFHAAVRRTESILRAMVGPELATQFTREVEDQRAR